MPMFHVNFGACFEVIQRPHAFPYIGLLRKPRQDGEAIAVFFFFEMLALAHEIVDEHGDAFGRHARAKRAWNGFALAVIKMAHGVPARGKSAGAVFGKIQMGGASRCRATFINHFLQPVRSRPNRAVSAVRSLVLVHVHGRCRAYLGPDRGEAWPRGCPADARPFAASRMTSTPQQFVRCLERLHCPKCRRLAHYVLRGELRNFRMGSRRGAATARLVYGPPPRRAPRRSATLPRLTAPAG